MPVYAEFRGSPRQMGCLDETLLSVNGSFPWHLISGLCNRASRLSKKTWTSVKSSAGLIFSIFQKTPESGTSFSLSDHPPVYIRRLVKVSKRRARMKWSQLFVGDVSVGCSLPRAMILSHTCPLWTLPSFVQQLIGSIQETYPYILERVRIDLLFLLPARCWRWGGGGISISPIDRSVFDRLTVSSRPHSVFLTYMKSTENGCVTFPQTTLSPPCLGHS